MDADQQEQSKHGQDAGDKPGGGAKQADNPRPEDVASEGEGLGGRTGGQGGGTETEPGGAHDAAQRRK
jgi:hypothetical protein